MTSLALKGIRLSAAACLFVGLSACSRTPVPASINVGTKFPSVVGQSLEKQEVKIPESYAGKVTVLLVGYQQKTQFDIDRWILGILQLETPVKIVEVPTIAGMMPQMVQGFINNGMRSGIPEEDWKTVVTVFDDAEKIIKALGNERPQSTYAVLLDKGGNIRRIFNNGYSAGNAKELDSLVRALEGS